MIQKFNDSKIQVIPCNPWDQKENFHESATKVQQKMHIRKQSEKNIRKIIDLQSIL